MKLRKFLAILTCTALLCGVLPVGSGVAAATDNLVINGDFENGTTEGWKTFDATAVSTEAAHSGQYGVATSGVGNWNSVLTQNVAVEANKTYTITIWAKTIAGGVNIHVKNNINSGDAFVTKYFSNTEWTKLTFIVTTTNSTKSLFLNFCGAGTEQTEVVWLDDISIVETPLITNGDFESGDATGWTTNKSTSVAKEAAYSGDYGLHLVGEGNWNSMAHQTFAVTAGATYELTFRLKTNAVGANIHIQDGVTKETLAKGGWFTTAEWTELSYTITAVGNTIFLNFCGGGTGSIEDLYLDDVTLTRLATASDDGFIKNGNFETGNDDYWTVFQETSISEAAAYEGSYGAVLKGDGGWGSTLNQTFTTVVGSEYVVTFYLKTVQKGTNIQIKNGETKLTSTWYSNTIWTKLSLTFTAVSTSTTLNFCGGGTGETEIVYLDNVVMTEILPIVQEEVVTGGESSIRDTAFGTKALAFRFTVDADGAQTVNTTEYVANSAIVKPWINDDATYALKYAGAIVSIDRSIEAESMEHDDVDKKKTKDVTAKYLCDIAEDSFSFAVRVIDIPDAQVNTMIYVRPYYVYEDENGREQIIYGDTYYNCYNNLVNAMIGE